METTQILAYIYIWPYIQGKGAVSLRADGEDVAFTFVYIEGLRGIASGSSFYMWALECA